MSTPADQWRTRLRDDLLAARKSRDEVRTNALRSALSAIDNAETPSDGAPTTTRDPDAAFAASTPGVGATDVLRRELADEEIRTLLQGEIDERLTAAGLAATGGFSDRAATLRSEATVLAELLATP